MNKAVVTVKPSAVDINLCAGAGGLAIGLTRAGFPPSGLYDKDRDACETLRINLNEFFLCEKWRVLEGDLTQLAWLANSEKIRLLAIGAPCQPFSIGGSRKGQNDERNLFPVILDAVRILRPRAVLIENVRGLGGAAHKTYLDYILNQIRYPDLVLKAGETWEDHARRLGQYRSSSRLRPTYCVRSAVINAADFGVPQIRYRLFIVATEADLPMYTFPTPTHSKQKLLWEQQTGTYWDKRGISPVKMERKLPKACDNESSLLPWVTVRDALRELPPSSPNETTERNNHWIIPGARPYPGHTGSPLDRPCKTLKAGVHGVPGGENMMVRDDGYVQYFTLREMARIQTFPDNYYFVGGRSSVTRQIGNAVPCELAHHISSPLLGLLGGSPSRGETGYRE